MIIFQMFLVNQVNQNWLIVTRTTLRLNGKHQSATVDHQLLVMMLKEEIVLLEDGLNLTKNPPEIWNIMMIVYKRVTNMNTEFLQLMLLALANLVMLPMSSLPNQ